MKISGLRLGMVYKKVYRAKDEDLHEIVEITEDNLGDYKRELISLGSVKAKSITAVQMSDLNNPKRWQFIDGAEIKKQIETTIVSKVIFADGTPEIILERHVIESETKMVSDEQTTPEAAIESEQEDVTSIDELKSTDGSEFYKGHNTNRVMKLNGHDSDFYYRMMSLTYNDLELLGNMVGGGLTCFRSIHSEPVGLSRQVHQSELQSFRDGKPLREIWNQGNRIKSFTQEQVGTKVSPMTIVRRMLKSFWHWGTAAEKAALQINKPLKDLPFGAENVIDQKRMKRKHSSRKAVGRKNGRRKNGQGLSNERV
jgi:hypothetical protein|tara:strand:- start:960 stop:1895 length:936 start_codon:yes stop_codon:yes gene_type:complete